MDATLDLMVLRRGQTASLRRKIDRSGNRNRTEMESLEKKTDSWAGDNLIQFKIGEQSL